MFMLLMWGYLLMLVRFTLNVKKLDWKCRHGDTKVNCMSDSVRGSEK